MKHIITKKGAQIIVDDDNFGFLSKFTWYINKRGYAQCDSFNGLRVMMHRIIVDVPKGKEVDHINQNKLDNRKENIRVCRHEENCRNRNKCRKTKSGFKGVYYYPLNCKKRPWQVGIVVKGKYNYIGSFNTVEEAAHAYNFAATKLHGDFASLNTL